MTFSGEKADGFTFSMILKGSSFQSVISLSKVMMMPTISTFASIIGACSVISSFEVGHQVQGQLKKTELFMDIKMGSALLGMYSKCGGTEDARRIFDHMPERNVFTWTSIIDGYGKNGASTEALQLFNRTLLDPLVKPNYVTFLSAVTACAHAGLVAKGWEIFYCLERDCFIKPRMEHYACIWLIS